MTNYDSLFTASCAKRISRPVRFRPPSSLRDPDLSQFNFGRIPRSVFSRFSRIWRTLFPLRVPRRTEPHLFSEIMHLYAPICIYMHLVAPVCTKMKKYGQLHKPHTGAQRDSLSASNGERVKGEVSIPLRAFAMFCLKPFRVVSVFRGLNRFLVLFGLIWCCLALFGPKIF